MMGKKHLRTNNPLPGQKHLIGHDVIIYKKIIVRMISYNTQQCKMFALLQNTGSESSRDYLQESRKQSRTKKLQKTKQGKMVTEQKSQL